MASKPANCLFAATMVALAICVTPAQALAGESAQPAYTPQLHDANALGMLMLARNALASYTEETSPLERRIDCSAAIEALTGLYQLYGCEWALPALLKTRALPECPQLLIGYSLDGRLMLRVEELELHNPVFDGSTICLCTLLSQTAVNIPGDSAAIVELILADGTRASALPVDEEHPQWENLNRLAPTFHPPEELITGTSVAFKQFFALEVPLGSVSAVSLVWGNYGMVVPNYMHVEGL